MRSMTFADALGVLLLQAKDGARRDALLGDGYERAREALPPFMVGTPFPDVYLEFPLVGDPFLDATMLLHDLDEGTRIDSPRAAGTERVLDWYARHSGTDGGISFGYEIDTATPETTPAAIHFQPRRRCDLVRSFCEAAGEPERANLYRAQDERMPKGWPLSFFGMFRGRPKSPLRVCGYLDGEEQGRCANDANLLRRVFDQVGFTAYDDCLLHDLSTLYGVVPGSTDFQFDVYPDGSLSDVFAIDARFDVAQPAEMVASFADGPASRLMVLLEAWGVADERWRLVPDMTFVRRLPMERDDGTFGTASFILMPQWIKIRWKNGELVPSKLYVLARADIS